MRNTEYDVVRIRRMANKARKEGKTNVEDIRIFQGRKFYQSVTLKRNKADDDVSGCV